MVFRVFACIRCLGVPGIWVFGVLGYLGVLCVGASSVRVFQVCGYVVSMGALDIKVFLVFEHLLL